MTEKIQPRIASLSEQGLSAIVKNFEHDTYARLEAHYHNTPIENAYSIIRGAAIDRVIARIDDPLQLEQIEEARDRGKQKSDVASSRRSWRRAFSDQYS